MSKSSAESLWRSNDHRGSVLGRLRASGTARVAYIDVDELRVRQKTERLDDLRGRPVRRVVEAGSPMSAGKDGLTAAGGEQKRWNAGYARVTPATRYDAMQTGGLLQSTPREVRVPLGRDDVSARRKRSDWIGRRSNILRAGKGSVRCRLAGWDAATGWRSDGWSELQNGRARGRPRGV